jgi:lantibiotic modifying enzyme
MAHPESAWRASAVWLPLHVCCGDFGKLELLLEAGRRLSRPDWVDAAGRRAAAIIARADAGRQGFSCMAGYTDSLFTPGLFTGMAGMGYQMLRLADPAQRLPSVLLW